MRCSSLRRPFGLSAGCAVGSDVRLLAGILLILTGCSAMYSGSVEIRESDLPRVRELLKEETSIRAIQRATGGAWSDFGMAMLYSFTSGTGKGFYESRIFYAGKSFPGFEGAFWDWYRQDRSGDSWFKLGSSQKIARWIWTTSLPHEYSHWLRFWSGNWLLASLSSFIVQNTVSSIIMSYGKHGEWRFSFGVDLPFR